MWTYKAEVLKILDGDTIEVSLDLGLGVRIRTPLRLYGVNSPETRTTNLAEKAAGLAASAFLGSLISGKEVVVVTIKPKDKYGRYLANVFLSEQDLVSVNQQMIDSGHGVHYDGGKREPFGPVP